MECKWEEVLSWEGDKQGREEKDKGRETGKKRERNRRDKCIRERRETVDEGMDKKKWKKLKKIKKREKET